MRSSGPGSVCGVAGRAGVCDCTLVLSVWNGVSTCCSYVCAFCNCCDGFWLDMIKFANASAWFAADCQSAYVAWERWFSVSAVSWIPLMLLVYGDVGAKPLPRSLSFSARRVVLKDAHRRSGSLRRCHYRIAKGNRWDCEIAPVAVVRVWPSG